MDQRHPDLTGISSLNSALFGGLSSLEELRLNDNALTSLPSGIFSGLTSLKDLDLANNAITTAGLPNGAFSPLTSLKGLALFGNDGAPFDLSSHTIATGAIVHQIQTPPANFKVEPGEGQVTLRWDEPSGTGTTHQYRYFADDGTESDWTDISSPTDLGTRLEVDVTGLTAGDNYLFQLRSVKSGAHSWHADADYHATYGTSGDDRLVVYSSPAYMVGLAGDDFLIGAGRTSKLEGGDGNDTLDVSESYGSSLSGGAGNDVLISGGGSTALDGGDGTDIASYAKADVGVTLNQADPTENSDEAEDDTFTGIERYEGSSTGDDTLIGDSNANYLRGGGGDDTLKGQGDADTLLGGPGDDTLEGGAGADTLNGGPGDDTLKGGAGSDTLVGETGNDTASYTDSSAAVTINLTTGAISGGDAAGDTFSSIESLIGTSQVDTLTGDANDNILEGGAGGDTLNGAGGNDTVSYASSDAAVTVGLWNNSVSGGHAASDTISNFENLIGSAHDDTLQGTANDDVIEGLAGGDSINGRNGSDAVSYRSSNAAVTVTLNAGGKESGGHAQGDQLQNIENVIGSAYDDSITGHTDDNVIEGLDGADTLDGNTGTDTLSYVSSDTGVTVDIGDNTASGGHAQGDSISNFESLTGSAYADTLTGNSSANVLTGGAGPDVLEGLGGSDTLKGGDGSDTASYASSPSAVTVNLTDGNVSGGHAAGDTLSGIEILVGSDHDDTLTGSLAVLEGGAGSDTLNGDTNTTVSYASSPSGVTVNLGGSTASGGHAQGDTLSNIRHLTGSAHDDALTGDGNKNYIEGGPGDDTLSPGATGGVTTDQFVFFSGFGDDTVTRLDKDTKLNLCVENARVVRNSTSKITVYESNDDISGTITNSGGNIADAHYQVLSPYDSECVYSPRQVNPDDENLRTWWINNTPFITDVGGATRVFVAVGTNQPGSAKCRVSATETINCPPGTFVSITPFDAPSDENTRLKMTATVTAGPQTASPMEQSFHYYGHSNPETEPISAGDGAIGVAWRAGATTHSSASINGYEVQHRVLREGGAWISSGVLAEDAFTYTIKGLTNGTTYEVRVAARNNAGDTDSSTHWWGPWSYDTATPQATNFGAAELSGFGTAALSITGAVQLNLVFPTEEVPRLLYYTLRYKQTSQDDDAWVEHNSLINRSASFHVYIINGLTSDVEYTFRIRAHNANGAGPWKETTQTPP